MATCGKICTLDELAILRNKAGKVIEERMQGEGTGKTKHHVLVCTGGGCIASGALDVKAALEKEIKSHALDKEVGIFETGCLGPCAVGPILVIYPGEVFYENVKPEDASEIVKVHLRKGAIVKRLLHKEPLTGKSVTAMRDIAFLRKQTKIVLRNCGVINPLSIEEYIGREGYLALGKVLTEMKPEEVIEVVKESGIRGRGGAGFPTWLKWKLARKTVGDQKYVLCNGDEGDPGAFMDRSVLEGDPHSVIEAMAIAAYAIGASEGFVYVRAEYPLAVTRLGKAIEDAHRLGFLGKGIFQTSFNFELEIRKGSGAFVCGEETALMASIEGNRGEPRPRPPFPSDKGLWGKPSVLNNVETLAAIPAIILKGAPWYASLGTEKSKGTKVFALAGAVNTTGLVEIPIGTPLEEIIFDIGGGIPGGKEFKAAQIGGPSGGCIPRNHLDVPVDYESLTELGAIMGSGGLIVMDEGACMVDIARFFLDFVQDESCGKCAPCRIGTRRMLEIVTRICQGQGQEGDIETLIELGTRIKDAALCGLGQTAPNPVLSTIRHFRHEYESHIRNKYCPSMVCKRICPAPCQRSCPVGVDVPSYNALIAEGRFEEALEVIRLDNPFPAVCGRMCNRPCERDCTLGETEEPLAIRSLKRFVSDYERGRWRPPAEPCPITQKEKVAVIGSGPAGLTAARDLRREGYAVTVFEAGKKPGGMLRLAIPEFRLPEESLDREIQTIQNTGVEIKTGIALGKDISIKELRKQGYQAILIATGAHKSVETNIPGFRPAKSCLTALEFLKDVKRGKPAKLAGDVLVVGPLYAGLDAARAAVRLGKVRVGMVFERKKSQLPFEKEEIKAAEQEGVVFHCLHRPTEVVWKNGKLKGLMCVRCRSQPPDATGRERAMPEDNGKIILPAQTIIVAGIQEPDLSLKPTDPDLKRNEWNFLRVDPVSMMTSEKGVFAAGDVTTGGATVIEAIGAGQKAAVTIHRYLRGIEQTEPYRFVKPRRRVETSDTGEIPETFKRPHEVLRPREERTHDFREADLTLSEKEGICESKRCLRCDMD